MRKAAVAGPVVWVLPQLALLSAAFAITVGYSIVLPVLPFLVERALGAGAATLLPRHTGLLTSTYVLAIFLFAPFWGWLSDHRGRKRVIIVGLIGFALSLGVFGLIEPTLTELYFGRFLQGAFGAAVIPSTYALVGDHAPSDGWRARRFAWINVASTAGFLVGPLVGALALRGAAIFVGTSERFSSAPFFATSLLAVIAALAILGCIADAKPNPSRAGRSAEIGISRYATVRLWFIDFAAALAIGAFEVGLALRGKQQLNLSPSQIGAMFIECSAVMIIVQVAVFSPLIKPEWTRYLFAPGLALLTTGLVLVPLADTYLETTAAVALVAATAGVLSPIVTYWVSLGAGQTVGADLGRAMAAASLGQAIGSAISGLFFDTSVVMNGGFLIAATVVAVVLVASAGLSSHLPRIGVALRTGELQNKSG